MPKKVSNELIFIEENNDYSINWTHSFNQLINWETDNELNELMAKLNIEKDDMHILWAHLKLSLESWKAYCQKGISIKIFYDTMRFFSRTVEECTKENGFICYSVQNWGIRHLTLKEFRIGAFEYEILEKQKLISIHIPSDANLSDLNREQSYSDANIFFSSYLDDYISYKFYCYSWMISPNLKGILKSKSNIISFIHDFESLNIDYSHDAYLKWVFNNSNCDVSDLPEKTSLQINLKKYLMDDKKLGIGYGFLKLDRCKLNK